jgi:hypothetical protein
VCRRMHDAPGHLHAAGLYQKKVNDRLPLGAERSLVKNAAYRRRSSWVYSLLADFQALHSGVDYNTYELFD